MEKLEYLLVRFLYLMFRFLPLQAAGLLAGSLTFMVKNIVRYRRRVIIDNLRHAFPELSEAGIRCMLPAVYRHFVCLWIESLQNRRVTFAYMEKYFTAEGLKELQTAAADGKPVLFYGGHIGNFEWLGIYLARHVQNFHAYMKRIHNPFINRFIEQNRKNSGISLIYTGDDALKKGLNCLKNGNSLALLADQDAGERGIYIDFMNRPAATAPGAAILHRLTKIPIFHCAAIRKKLGKFHVIIERIPELPQAGDNAVDIFNLTQYLAGRLENLVRQYPEQYFWTHRRWKNQPAADEMHTYTANVRRYREGIA